MVYEFRIAKRGSQSDWERDESGAYIRYYAHADKGEIMHWKPATEAQIDEANQESGLSDEDVYALFKTGEELLPNEVTKKLEADGLRFTGDQLEKIIQRLALKRKITKIGMAYVAAKVAKKSARENETIEEVFTIIQKSMPDGIITKELIKAAPFGKDTVMEGVETLLDKKRITVDVTKKGIVESRRYLTL
jgi:hypothetical protein